MSTLNDWPDEIHLIGAGGISNHVLLILNELGARTVHVWDDDVVAGHNRPNQFMFTKKDIGQPKVDAMVRFAERQDWDTVVVPHQERVHVKVDILCGIVISGVDSIESRRDIWQAVQKTKVYIPLYLDGRITDEFSHIFDVDPCDSVRVERYEKSLVSAPKSNAARNCTTRENPHSAFDIAKSVSTHLTLFLRGQTAKEAVYRNLLQEARSVQSPLVVPQ